MLFTEQIKNIDNDVVLSPDEKELDDEVAGNRGDEGVLIGALIKDEDETNEAETESDDNEDSDVGFLIF